MGRRAATGGIAEDVVVMGGGAADPTGRYGLRSSSSSSSSTSSMSGRVNGGSRGRCVRLPDLQSMMRRTKDASQKPTGGVRRNE